MAAYKEILGLVERAKKGGGDQETQTFWTKIGVAFPQRDGDGWFLQFDFMPTKPDIKIVMKDPRPKPGYPDRSVKGTIPNAPAPDGALVDDDIPY